MAEITFADSYMAKPVMDSTLCSLLYGACHVSTHCVSNCLSNSPTEAACLLLQWSWTQLLVLQMREWEGPLQMQIKTYILFLKFGDSPWHGSKECEGERERKGDQDRSTHREGGRVSNWFVRWTTKTTRKNKMFQVSRCPSLLVARRSMTLWMLS